MKTPQDFDRFYYRKVGLGEGCGCAERVIDMHEFDRLAGTQVRKPYRPRIGLAGRLKRLFLSRRGTDIAAKD